MIPVIVQVALLMAVLAFIVGFVVWALLPKSWQSVNRWSVGEAGMFFFIASFIVCGVFLTTYKDEPIFVSNEAAQSILNFAYGTWSFVTVGSGSAVMAAYAALGLIWSTLHFWLYAKRLGQTYVLARDQWLTANGKASVADLDAAQRKQFETVIAKVKSRMHYEGDFPLKVLQQKRFFAGNVLFWPVTLLIYILWDLLRDVALNVVYALRDQVSKWWASAMRTYELDTEIVTKKYFSPEAAAAAEPA